MPVIGGAVEEIQDSVKYTSYSKQLAELEPELLERQSKLTHSVCEHCRDNSPNDEDSRNTCAVFDIRRYRLCLRNGGFSDISAQFQLHW
jgi:hypothetical protein